MSPNKDETTVHCCDPALPVLVMLVSRDVFDRSISLAVYCSSLPFGLADQIDPTLAAFMVSSLL